MEKLNQITQEEKEKFWEEPEHKSLTPLEKLKKIKQFVIDEYSYNNVDGFSNEEIKQFVEEKFNFNSVETALIDYEKQKDYYAKLLESVINDKEHKALEIIKEYELDMKVIIYCIENNIDYAEYVERELWVEAQDKSPMEPMPQEKFDLLKEVFKEYEKEN